MSNKLHSKPIGSASKTGIKEFIAHRRKKDGEPQSLCSHISATSIYAGQFADKIGLKEAGRIIGLLHDIGKASNAFDKYIKSATGCIDPDADDYIDAKERDANTESFFKEIDRLLKNKLN